MWLSRESSLLPTPAPQGHDEQQSPVRYNDLPMYALRGYRGREILIAKKPIEGAYPAEKFLAGHVADLEYRKSPIPKPLISRDIERVMGMATTSLAVRIVPLV